MKSSGQAVLTNSKWCSQSQSVCSFRVSHQRSITASRNPTITVRPGRTGRAASGIWISIYIYKRPPPNFANVDNGGGESRRPTRCRLRRPESLPETMKAKKQRARSFLCFGAPVTADESATVKNEEEEEEVEKKKLRRSMSKLVRSISFKSSKSSVSLFELRWDFEFESSASRVKVFNFWWDFEFVSLFLDLKV